MDDVQERIPATAYCGDAAHHYDESRFSRRQGRLFSDLEFQQLRRVTRSLDASSLILEVGCGTARFAAHLAEQGYSVVATDPSPDMIEVASRKCSALEGVSFQREEGARLSFADATFDLVFAIRVTNQTESEEYALRTIREMIRVARPGGQVLVEFVNRDRPFPKRTPSVRLTFGQISQIARQCGSEVEARRGVLVFSQSLLDRVPGPLVPLWGAAEWAAARLFWRWASRGYILLRKW